MDYKEMYNILQDMEYADKVKDSIEDLYLFLNEIENMIHSNNNAVNKKVNEYTINPMLIFKFWPILIVIPLNKQDIIKSIYKIIE